MFLNQLPGMLKCGQIRGWYWLNQRKPYFTHFTYSENVGREMEEIQMLLFYLQTLVCNGTKLVSIINIVIMLPK